MTEEQTLSHKISIRGVDPLSLYGHNDSNLIAIENRYGVRVTARGDTIRVDGLASRVRTVSSLFDEMISLVSNNMP